jgi:bacteriocin-like protein
MAEGTPPSDAPKIDQSGTTQTLTEEELNSISGGVHQPSPGSGAGAGAGTGSGTGAGTGSGSTTGGSTSGSGSVSGG